MHHANDLEASPQNGSNLQTNISCFFFKGGETNQITTIAKRMTNVCLASNKREDFLFLFCFSPWRFSCIKMRSVLRFRYLVDGWIVDYSRCDF